MRATRRPRGAMAQDGPHQGAVAIWPSLSPPISTTTQMTRKGNEERPVRAVLTGRPSMLCPDMKCPTAAPCGFDQSNGQSIKRQKIYRPPRCARNNTAMMGEIRIDAPSVVEAHVMRTEVADHGAQRCRNDMLDPVAEVRLGSRAHQRFLKMNLTVLRLA